MSPKTDTVTFCRLLPVSALVCVLHASAMDVAPVTPLFSADFESAGQAGTLPPDWTHFSDVRTVEVSTERAHAGRFSLKLVDEDPVHAVGLRSSHVKVAPGDFCWVTWWYYGQKRNHQSMYIEFWTADGRRPDPPSRSFPSRGCGEWVRGVGRARAPEGTATVTVHANSFSTNTATGYFDDVAFGVGPMAIYDRRPQPPAEVPHPCGLYKPADIDRAKSNIEAHEWAVKTLASIKSSAEFWVQCPEDRLSYWIPDLTPFRVVDCPKCEAGWRFAWTSIGYDKIKCRNCGLTWPDPAYPEDKVQDFLDPVGGEQRIPYYAGKPSTVYGSAKSPVYRLSGRLRYHRVGRLGSLGDVGKAYALTGEGKYAETVRRVLLRLAQVYPHYLPHDWLRIFGDYDNLQSGKLSGWKLHDAGVFIQLATAYDLTYNSGVYTAADKVAIEERCFREFARLMTATSPRGCCINDGPTAMAAGALAGLMLADHNVVAWAIEPPDGFIGFLEDYFIRDGHWYEASPSYEGMSLSRLYVTPEALRGYSDPPTYDGPNRYDALDLFKHPLMKKILRAGAYEVMPDGRLPATNDSTLGAHYSATRAEQNAFWYPSEASFQLMAWAFGGKVTAGNEYAMFRRDPDLDLSGVTPLAPSSRSIVRPDVGWAILRTGDRGHDAALMLDYGPHGSGHGHPDRLNLIYYDYGTELVTDLGYLGAGHPHHPWIRSTAAHNLVVVDGKPQARSAGELEAFCGAGSVKAAIASAPAVYKDTVETYRRYMVLVDHGVGRRYIVDRFDVRGGHTHQYLFHGEGEGFEPPSLEFGNQAIAELGDALTGYKWMKDVRSAQVDEPFVCTWIADPVSGLGTRLHMLGAAGTELIHARASGLRNRSTPFASRDMHKIMVRRDGPENQFLAVIEGVKGGVGIESVRELTAAAERGSAKAVEVRHGDAVDIVIIAAQGTAAETVRVREYPGLEFSGRIAFVGLAKQRLHTAWMLGGSRLAYEGISLHGSARFAGVIESVDTEQFTVAVDCELAPGRGWAGQYVLIEGRSDGAYAMTEVTSANGTSVIHLAGEPIMRLEPGDRFTIVPSASAELLGADLWHVRTGGAPLDIELRRPRTLAAADARIRVPDGPWRPLAHAAAGGGLDRIRLDPSVLGSNEAWVLLSPAGRDLADTTAPTLTACLVAGTEREEFADLGYISPGAEVAVVFEDRNALADGSVRARLMGRRSGLVELRLESQCEALQDGHRQRVTLRAAADGRLPPDQYTLAFEAMDTLGNTAAYELSLNTEGLVFPFEAMAIAASSGKLCKPLGGLRTMFYRSEGPGDFVTYAFDVPAAGRYRAKLRYTTYSGYGIFRVHLDGAEVGGDIDAYAEALLAGGGSADLGVHEVTVGRHEIRLDTVGRNPDAPTSYIGVCELVLVPAE